MMAVSSHSQWCFPHSSHVLFQLALALVLATALGIGLPCASLSMVAAVVASFCLGTFGAAGLLLRPARQLGELEARLQSTHSLLCDLLPSHVVQDLLQQEETKSAETDCEDNTDHSYCGADGVDDAERSAATGATAAADRGNRGSAVGACQPPTLCRIESLSAPCSLSCTTRHSTAGQLSGLMLGQYASPRVPSGGYGGSGEATCATMMSSVAEHSLGGGVEGRLAVSHGSNGHSQSGWTPHFASSLSSSISRSYSGRHSADHHVLTTGSCSQWPSQSHAPPRSSWNFQTSHQHQPQLQQERSSTSGSSHHLDRTFAEAHDCVTILFADICGFTHFSQQVTCKKVLETLNDLYCRFDQICSTMPVYKIQVIGDAYMCASGLLHQDPDHAETMLRFATALLDECSKVIMPHSQEPVSVRIGISSGSVMSGLVGRLRRQFSIFGETVNIASRMEATSHAGGIHISEATYRLVGHLPQYTWRQQVSEVKSMGRTTSYMLVTEAEVARTAPAWQASAELAGAAPPSSSSSSSSSVLPKAPRPSGFTRTAAGLPSAGRRHAGVLPLPPAAPDLHSSSGLIKSWTVEASVFDRFLDGEQSHRASGSPGSARLPREGKGRIDDVDDIVDALLPEHSIS